MTDGTRPRLLLVDGHSMAYRAFYALPVDNFATTAGQPTNAVFGFTSMLTNLLQIEKPTHLAVAFDVGRVTFRTARYPAYKATREASPEAFRGQVDVIKSVLAAMNIPVIEKPDFEADDILATLARQGADAGMEVLVCSGDRDALQVVTEDVTVLYPVRGVSELARMTPESVQAKYGVPPQRYPDIAALVGESSDNLPGVPGVGPKTAVKWVTAYDGLTGVVAHAGDIKGKVGESLREHLDQVVLNRELNRLVDDLELPYHPDDLTRRPWDRQAVLELLDELEFRALRERVLAVAPQDDGSLGAQVDEPVGADSPELVALADGELADWLTTRVGQTAGLDVQGSPAPTGGDAWGIAVAIGGEAVAYDLLRMDPADEAALGRWLADTDQPKVVHAAKEAWHALAGRGLALHGVAFDTELGAYLLSPDRRGYDLSALALAYLHRELTPVETTAEGQGSFDLSVDGSQEMERGAVRAAAVLDLANALVEQLADRGAAHLLTEVELPLQQVLAQMEQVGIAVDADYLRQLEREYDLVVQQAAAEAYAVIGREVNLGSPKQLQEVLFDQLGMPKTKKIKTGYTTDASALADLFTRTEHPFLAQLLAHRDAIKLRQIVEGLLRAVAPDRRIHTTFQQTIAATGRLSSTDPNLQNIPIRTDAGRRIRGAFVVGEGFEALLTADYSQIEMRIMAHLSGDEELIDAFQGGEDLHSYVASRVFGVPTDQVTSAQRSKIKAMSYGLAYGLSSYGLSQQLKVDVGEAASLMADYFERFGGVRDFLSGVAQQARVVGYTETLLGRRRYLPDLTSDNRMRRESAERMALNAPIQGSAADIIKIAMLKVHRELDRQALGSRLLLQVHDELVLEVVPGERSAVETLVREQMGAAYQLAVPLDVSVGWGDSWHTAGH